MKNFILSIQHLLAMFGATVLVPILTGFDPSVAIFCAGLGTLIFHLCTKRKVPVFLGSSFAFIPVVITANEISGGDTSFAQGGIIIAGIIYVIMSFLIKFIGVDRIKSYFPPQVTGAMITVIGLNLLPSAFNMASEHILIAIITLIITLLINLFTKGFVKQLGILIGVGVGYILSIILNQVDMSLLANAPLFRIPNFTLPKFSLETMIIIAPIVIAVFMEHIGDMTTNGTVVGKNFIKDPGLNRTLLGDGLATIASGIIGGPANTTYGENTAVLALTKNYNPALLRITAIYAMLLSFIGIFGTFLQTIPQAVMGGISILLFSMIAFIGMKNINDSKCIKVNKKNIIIILTIVIIGIGTTYLGNKGISIGIPITSNVSISGLSLAAIVGLILNRILNHKDFAKKKAI